MFFVTFPSLARANHNSDMILVHQNKHLSSDIHKWDFYALRAFFLYLFIYLRKKGLQTPLGWVDLDSLYGFPLLIHWTISYKKKVMYIS